MLVFKLDRAFRSWEPLGVGFQSVREGFDTRTARGRLLLNLLASLAEFELELISERVRAGMDRARRQGQHIGRPSVMPTPGFEQRWAAVRDQLLVGNIGIRTAARRLGIGVGTVHRFLAADRAFQNGGAAKEPGTALTIGLS